MNRRDRRAMEEKLGVRKHIKTLPRKERLERIRQNIIEGHHKQDEMNEVLRHQKQGNQDKIDNNKISSLATELMINENLDYIDALEKATQIYNKK